MMRFGIRARLLGLSLLLFGIVALSGGAWLESLHRARLQSQIETDLTRHARMAAGILEHRSEIRSLESFHMLSKLLGEQDVIRVTFIDQEGFVVGDSMVPTASIHGIENHGTRPEIAAVMGRDSLPVATFRRYSETIQRNMLYVAIPAAHPKVAVVRVAMPLDELDRQITSPGLPWLVATTIGVALAALLAAVGTHWVTRDLRALVLRARRLAPKDSPTLETADEIAGLSGSFEALAAALRQAIEDQDARRLEFESVLTGMEEGIIALDSDARMTIVNKAAQRLFDLSSPSIGTSILTATGLPALTRVGREAILGEPSTTELVLPSAIRTAPPRRVRVRATPQPDEGAILVLSDITELRRLERIRSDFVANVSHELRTPVTAMQISAEALRDGALEHPQTAERFVDAILRNGARLSHLLTDLLELAAMEGGHHQLHTAPVTVRSVVTHAAKTMAQKLIQKNHTLHLTVEPDVAVLADDAKLEQIIVNFLDNAIKYTPPGGQITVQTSSLNSRIRIEVEDDGPGIPPHHRTRLFERFYRVDPGRSRDMGGTGLGLAIVRHLAQLMGGEAGMEPAADKGSIFWVIFDSAP